MKHKQPEKSINIKHIQNKIEIRKSLVLQQTNDIWYQVNVEHVRVCVCVIMCANEFMWLRKSFHVQPNNDELNTEMERIFIVDRKAHFSKNFSTSHR